MYDYICFCTRTSSKRKCLFKEAFKKIILFFFKRISFKKKRHRIRDQRRHRDQWQESSETLRGIANQRNQRISERRYRILHVTLYTVMNQWEHRGHGQRNQQATIESVDFWKMGPDIVCDVMHSCGLVERDTPGRDTTLEIGRGHIMYQGGFWSKLHSVLMHSEVLTPLSITVRTVYTAAFNIRSHLWKSVDSVELTDPHVSSERQLWESMICNSISVLYLRNPLISLCTFPARSADLDSGVSTSSLLRIGRHAISDPNFQKSIDFTDPDSCVVSCWKTSFSKDKTLFFKSSLNNCFLFQDVLLQRRLRIRHLKTNTFWKRSLLKKHFL